jgi:hypothetical protein
VTVSNFLQLVMGGGLLGAALKVGAAVRDFRAGFEALQQALQLHVANHPGPSPAANQETTNVPA